MTSRAKTELLNASPWAKDSLGLHLCYTLRYSIVTADRVPLDLKGCWMRCDFCSRAVERIHPPLAQSLTIATTANSRVLILCSFIESTFKLLYFQEFKFIKSTSEPKKITEYLSD